MPFSHMVSCCASTAARQGILDCQCILSNADEAAESLWTGRCPKEFWQEDLENSHERAVGPWYICKRAER